MAHNVPLQPSNVITYASDSSNGIYCDFSLLSLIPWKRLKPLCNEKSICFTLVKLRDTCYRNHSVTKTTRVSCQIWHTHTHTQPGHKLTLHTSIPYILADVGVLSTVRLPPWRRRLIASPPLLDRSPANSRRISLIVLSIADFIL